VLRLNFRQHLIEYPDAIIGREPNGFRRQSTYLTHVSSARQRAAPSPRVPTPPRRYRQLAVPSHSLEPLLHPAILPQHHGKYRLDATPGPLARITAYLRAHGGRVLIEALINFILPYVIYTVAEARLGEVGALLASSAPPILWSIFEFARDRRIDALSVLVVAGIALSLLAMVGGGGAQFLQVREKLVTGVIGLAFLGSALIGKPLIYELARASMRRKSEGEAQQFEALQSHAGFRRTMTVMTLVWGLGLLCDVAVSVVLVFALSIRTYLIVNPLIGYGTMGALGLWTFLYGRRARRRGEARGAASPAAQVVSVPGGDGGCSSDGRPI